MTQALSLRYGSTQLEGELDAGLVDTLEPAFSATGTTPSALLRDAIHSDRLGVTLAQAVGRARRITVVVSDKTRKVGYRAFLSELLSAIHERGAPANTIDLLVALGTHDAHTDSENEYLYGRLPGFVSIHQHDCRDSASLVDVGELPYNRMRLRVNRRAVECDALVLTGGVTFHYQAGFGGGRKSILPGIAAFENVLANHQQALGAAPGVCAPGVTDGNPVAAGMDRALQLLPAAYAVNTVMGVSAVDALFAGLPAEVLARGARYMTERYCRTWPVPFDCVIASAGGVPKDLNFYQSHKAMDHAFRACRPGGTLILAAECAQGVGPAQFENWATHTGSIEEHYHSLRTTYSVDGHIAYNFRKKLESVSCICISALDPGTVARMGMVPAPSLAAAIAMVRERSGGALGRLLVMPYGSDTLPIIRP